VRDSGYDKGKQDGHREATGGKGGSGSGARYDEGIRDAHAEVAWKNVTSVSGGSDIPAHDGRGGGPSSCGGSGPKVLKKGAAGHGGGKKRRRY